MWPIMVSTMVRPLGRALSKNDWQAFHVAPHPGHQGEAAAEQSLREVLADIAFVAAQLADQVPGQLRHRRGVIDAAGRQCKRDDLAFMIEHQMQLQAEEPARAGLATVGQAGKHLVAVDAMRMTHRQRRAVDAIDPCPSSHPGEQKDRQGHPYVLGQRNEAGVTGGFGRSGAQRSENDALVERLEMPEFEP